MASVNAYYRFDQNNLSLNRVYSNSFEATFLDDAYLEYGESTYRDIYIVDWYLGGYYASVFAGDYITVDRSVNVTGGTINGYLELVGNGFDYTQLWSIEGVSLSAEALFRAAITPSTADDYGLFDSALAGDDEFLLSEEADIAFGRGGDDWMLGFAGNDILSGEAGNDVIMGGAGNDIINGGGGNDTAAFSGSISSYTLTLGPGSATTLTDRRIGGDDTDTISGVEILSFGSETGLIDLTQFGGTTNLSGQDFESFISLYIAYFNRAPDALGLNFWGTAFANGVSFQEIARLFMDQDETRAAYPSSLSNVDFATAVYNNVLGRIPDQAGLDFWVEVLDSGARGRDQFILSVLEGVQDGSADRIYLDSKIDVGAYYAVHKGMSDVADAVAVMALFDGSQSSIDRAVAVIDADYAEALDPTSGEFLMPIVGVLDNPFA